MNRANSRCELCAAATDLSIYDVLPNAGASAETCVLLCGTCLMQINDPPTMDAKHWYCLRESMWSEHPPVKVLAYRVLKLLGTDPLAQELLGQIYLEPEEQQWADSGAGATPGDDGAVVIRDSNGTVLSEGDSVTLIKDLEVKGAGFTAKRGTTVKDINLTDDPKYVEGRVNGIRIVLVAAFLKKA